MPRSAIGSVEATDLENRNGAAKLRISCFPDPLSGPCFLKTGEGGSHFSIVQDLTLTPVLDARLAAAIGRHIAEQPRSRFFFPEDSPKPDPGKPLTLKFCARCHAEDGDRDVLHQVHSHPIRVLVDFGYMPPNRRLKPEEISELKAWLEHKP